MSFRLMFLFVLLATASFAVPVIDLLGLTLGSGTSDTGPAGEQIIANYDVNLINVTKVSACSATRVRLITEDGATVLATATYNGDVAEFTGASMVAGTKYRIVCDKSGVVYMRAYTTSASYPYPRTNINYTAYWYNADNNYADCIYSITTEIPQLTHALIVSMPSPTNVTIPGSSFTSTTPDINITASGDNESYLCNITEGSNYLLANQDILNNTLFSLTNTSFAPGAHTLNATCFNSTYENSSTVTFTAIDLYDCGTLSSSGFYSLKTDVASAGDCFDIDSPEISLDCEGHTLTGPGSDYGIYITAANASIYNCTATNYTVAFYVAAADNATLVNNFAYDLPPASVGFFLENSNFTNLTNNSAYTNCGNCDGFDIGDGNNNTLADNLAFNNGLGFSLYSTCTGNTLTGNTAYNNSYQIYLNGTTVTDNLIYNNILNATAGQEVALDGGLNFWNTTKTLGTNIIGGPYIGGNWYSNYTGADTTGDGIGNETYGIDASTDYLPLTTFILSLSVIIHSPLNTSYNISPTSINASCNGNYHLAYRMTINSEGIPIATNISVQNGTPYVLFNPVAATGTHSIDITCNNASLYNMSAVTWTVPVPGAPLVSSQGWMFVAAIITAISVIIAFLYLYSRTPEPFWQTTWLFGVFLLIDYSVELTRYGLVTLAGITPLDDLTFGILNTANWLVVLVTFYLGYLLLRNLIGIFFGLFSSMRGYGGTGKEREEERHG